MCEHCWCITVKVSGKFHEQCCICEARQEMRDIEIPILQSGRG